MIGGVIVLIAGMMAWSAQPASAQCGSSASSCKNCHETQGVMPVSANGEWHSAHAFGDFCEFCHAGNVQAKGKEEAHVGLAEPLADAQASCQSCHPTDYVELAQTYGTTLGVEVGTGNGSGGRGGSDSGGSDSGSNVGATSVGAPLGGEEIDFNLLYAEAAAGEGGINWGNVILALMTLAVAGAFFVTAWSWEGWGEQVARWIYRNVAPIPQAAAAASGRADSGAMLNQALANRNEAQVQALLEQKPELQALLPRLMACPPETLAALDHILENPERGGEILSAITRIDLELVTALRQVGAKDRNLLLALVKEM